VIDFYVGKIRHQRMRPQRHAFTYRVFWAFLDLDNRQQIGEQSLLLSFNRWNLFSFHDKDHGPRDGSDLRTWIDEIHTESGLELGKVSLLCFPRILGFVFNPLSMWFCHDRSGNIVSIVYEVRNTFGESHAYIMRVDDPQKIRHVWDKRLFVSPFIDMDATYDFRVAVPDEHLKVSVRENDSQGHLFSAVMAGMRKPVNTKTLIQLFVSHPLMTFKVVGGIHVEAFRLWRKKAPYRSRPEAPEPVSFPTAELIP